MKVLVYQNRPSGQFAITALEGTQQGQVVAHARHVDLFDVEFTVLPPEGEDTEIRAGAVGRWVQGLDQLGEAVYEEAVHVAFRSHPAPYFVRQDNRLPVRHAAFARLDDRVIRALI